MFCCASRKNCVIRTPKQYCTLGQPVKLKHLPLTLRTIVKPLWTIVYCNGWFLSQRGLFCNLITELSWRFVSLNWERKTKTKKKRKPHGLKTNKYDVWRHCWRCCFADVVRCNFHLAWAYKVTSWNQGAVHIGGGVGGGLYLPKTVQSGDLFPTPPGLDLMHGRHVVVVL